MDSITQPTHPLHRLNHSATFAPSWHVLWTLSHSERLVHDQLASRGFHVFLPTIETWVRRHGMRHRATVPMFAGYLFIHHPMDPQSYIEVCETRGLVKLLGNSWNHLAVLPERDVQTISRLHASRLSATPHPYLEAGQRVRVVGGLLAGVEGILLRINPSKGLFVISVDLLQRSVAVEIDCTLVAPV